MRILHVLVFVAALAAVAPPAQAQQAGPDLPDRELAYRAARSQHRSAVDAWSVVEKQWNDAMDDHARARRAGDRGRQDEALTRALDLARELERLERRVNDAAGELARARSELRAAIERRIVVLERQMEAARTAGERGRLAALVRDLENQERQLLAEAEDPGVRSELVYYQSIQYDTRDDAATLAAKAELLRSKAEQADSVIAEIDREIERVERQLRRSQNVRSLVTGVERFGDIQAPGAPGRRATGADVRARPDSAGVARPEQTPEQQLLELRILRAQVESAKSSFLQRAETFDSLVRRIG